MVGAAGKSAQIPLYVWLPDAMEGPTPVSALIHAATMVTAGVYMVARSHVIFERAPMALTVVAIIGTLTALFAATIGIAQTDIKKVLAYSTVSQLGYMFMACGVGAFSAGIFHLMTHAFFKGLLFLAAGSVIHGVGGEQDMRKMGGLRQYMPWTFATMGIATLAIAGIPPFAGFWSKDEILWQAFGTSWVYWLIGVITAFITSFYMFRLMYMTFGGEYRGARADQVIALMRHDDHGHDNHGHGHGDPHESPWVMLGPLVVLRCCLWSADSSATEIASNISWLRCSSRERHVVAQETLPTRERHRVSADGISISVAGSRMAAGLSALQPPSATARAHRRQLGGLYQAVVHKYYVDELYAVRFRQAADRRLDRDSLARRRPGSDRRHGERLSHRRPRRI
jgi:NADH-quinone oxidoreductase subunit L